MNICKLSATEAGSQATGNTVVMVGSFAPIHRGHFDAVRAAGNAIVERGMPIENIVLSPNSDDYLMRKLRGEEHTWTYDRRIEEIMSRDLPLDGIPTYVDDISGRLVGLNEINHQVPRTLRQYLGQTAEQLYFVTGSDQICSMQCHLADPAKRAICVLRPDGALDIAYAQLEQDWARQAIEDGRYIVTEREDMENDVSSTAIRRGEA